MFIPRVLGPHLNLEGEGGKEVNALKSAQLVVYFRGFILEGKTFTPSDLRVKRATSGTLENGLKESRFTDIL